ncbi:MAG: ferredoxin:thioredoxin reductase [Candidatus Helarchaeota archaeon]|nr:ferredoxin:thioredoxin reductase [Candidatus Helarchaeota archaeon]
MPDIEDTKKYVKTVAEHRKWVLQPDETMFNDLVEGLAVNKERFGYRSCPCRLATGEKEKDRDIICPCQYSEPDIKEFGHCFCALFLSKEFIQSGKESNKIPERRPQEKL